MPLAVKPADWGSGHKWNGSGQCPPQGLRKGHLGIRALLTQVCIQRGAADAALPAAPPAPQRLAQIGGGHPDGPRDQFCRDDRGNRMRRGIRKKCADFRYRSVKCMRKYRRFKLRATESSEHLRGIRAGQFNESSIPIEFTRFFNSIHAIAQVRCNQTDGVPDIGALKQ